MALHGMHSSCFLGSLSIKSFFLCDNHIHVCVSYHTWFKQTPDPHLKHPTRDFPGGPVVKNLPCNAGDVGLNPSWGTRIPHVMEQLSPSSATTEPAPSEACVPQRKILHDTTKTHWCSKTTTTTTKKPPPTKQPTNPLRWCHISLELWSNKPLLGMAWNNVEGHYTEVPR